MSAADAPLPGSSDRFQVVKFVSMCIIAFVVVSPLFLLLVASLKPDRFQILAEMGSFKAFFVSNPTLQNYGDILTFSGNQPFARYLVNSVIVLVFTLAGGMLFNSMAAFVLAWGKLPGRALILTLMIGLYIVPQESIVLPLLNVVNRLGFNDSFAAQIIPFWASPLYVFLLYQFFSQVPRDLYDAAIVDGASPFEIYWKVFMPLSLPALATVAILLGIETWNQYLWPLLVTQSNYARPISVGIAGFFGADSIYWNLAMAASVVMMAPVLTLYLVFQKWFVSSVISSGVKG